MVIMMTTVVLLLFESFFMHRSVVAINFHFNSKSENEIVLKYGFYQLFSELYSSLLV